MELRGFFWLFVVLLVGAWLGDKFPGFNLIGRVTGSAGEEN